MKRWLFALFGLSLAFFFDLSIDLWVAQFSTPWLLTLSHWICPFFSPPFAAILIVILILSSLLRDKLKNALCYTESLFVLFLTEFVVQILKLSITRARPYDPSLLDSFPSSHTAMLFILCRLLPLHLQRMGYGIALLLSLLRLFDGHHHLSDLYAGALLALAISQWGGFYWNMEQIKKPTRGLAFYNQGFLKRIKQLF